MVAVENGGNTMAGLAPCQLSWTRAWLLPQWAGQQGWGRLLKASDWGVATTILASYRSDQPGLSWPEKLTVEYTQMINPMYAMLNQQFMLGCGFGQQGMQAESFGNPGAAAQLYDQAAGCIQQCIALAAQSGTPIPEHVFFTAALAHFNAFRIKGTLGMGPMAWLNLNMGLQAINSAIGLNPNQYQYHSLAGMFMLAMGNLSEAERALSGALRLNPSDPWSRYLLTYLYSLQGNISQANQVYSPLQSMMANTGQAMPPMPSSARSVANNLKTGDDVIAKVGDIAVMLTKVFGAIAGFQSMMQW